MPQPTTRLPRLLSLLLLLAVLGPSAFAQDGPTQDGLNYQEQPEGSPILAFYDFEEPVPSGPHTYWLRDRFGNRVDLTTAYRISGERSLAVREEPGNRDFAEFLGYFRTRKDAAVYVQFYVLFTDLDEKFNFGLAGPSWFLSRDRGGQALWLQTSEGKLWHYPAYERRELFTPRTFEWYFVDVVYDVEQGTYDLAIFEERCGEECNEEGEPAPIVDLRDQRNTCDHDRSPVKYFSFIGDLEDEGRFAYFVDDFLLATDPAVRLKPFVAPGRRRFFVEIYAGKRPRLDDDAREDLLWEARQWLGNPPRKTTPQPATPQPAAVERMELAGDEAFLAGDLELALELFRRLPEGHRTTLKLADVYHQMGDVEAERQLRESIYGRMELEELK